jgi:uncharacterized protein (DUF1501 family)
LLTGTERFFLVNALAVPNAPPDDYKALVCIFLYGGNDSNNTVVPIDGYAEYAAVRGSLAIPQENLLSITPPSDGRAFGLHPSLSRLHALWQQKKVALITNVGSLIEPLTKDLYKSRPDLVPYQLFSHSDQQSEWQSSYANGTLPSGWGGRIADLTQDDKTGFPTIMSVAGVTLFTAGETTSPLVLPPAPTPLNQALVLARPGDTVEDSVFRQLIDLGSAESSPTLVRAVAEISGRAVANSLALNVDPVITTAFPESQLGNELKQIAKFIKFSQDLGIKRQIFFCSLGGFDTHSNQGGETGTQANLLRDVSDAMGAFYDATIELGVSSHVTTFTMSDFSRTFKPAGAGAATGTDHAWGSHQFAMGEAITGGDFYGHYPNLALSGPDDSDEGTNARGRWIPTTAVDQYAATLALWFGVSSGDLSLVFPNIGHFGTADLGFLQ